MPDLLLRGGRPWGVDAPADVLIREGIIDQSRQHRMNHRGHARGAGL